MGWADSATDGATGGRGGYGGNAAGGGYGNDNAIGRAVEAAAEDNGGFGATSTHTHFSGSSVSYGSKRPGPVDDGSRSNAAATANTQGGRLGREIDAQPSTTNQGITNGAIASLDEVADQAERSFLDRTSFTTYADTPRSYNATPAMSRAESMVETIADQTGRKASDVGQMVGREDFDSMVAGNLDAAYGGVQQASQPHGLISTVQNVGLGLLGVPGMALDTAIDSYTGGRKAANTFDALNDRYGTSFDSDLATNIGRHAASNTLGAIASMGLSRAGVNTGFSLAGVNGARVGGLLGNAAGGQIGDMALEDPGTTQQVASNTTPSGSGQPRGLLSSAVATTQAPVTQPAKPDFGFADFDGYASYAESFFA